MVKQNDVEGAPGTPRSSDKDISTASLALEARFETKQSCTMQRPKVSRQSGIVGHRLERARGRGGRAECAMLRRLEAK